MALLALPPLAEPTTEALRARMTALLATYGIDMEAQTAQTAKALQTPGLNPEAVATDYGVGMAELAAGLQAEMVQQTLAALNLPIQPHVDLWTQLQQASRGDVVKLLRQIDSGQLPAEWRLLPPEQIQRLRAALNALA